MATLNSNYPILELRVAVTTMDYKRLLKFYTDGLGLEPAQLWQNGQGHAAILNMGHATLEIFDEAQAQTIDEIEAGQRVSGQIRFALQVPDLQAALAQDKMWVPLGSPWNKSTLGGIVAANFNAPLRMRYGALRDLVLTAIVALPNGRVIRAGRPLVKNVAGYDIPKLFVGSYGTLGVITDVTLKLAPLPRARASLIVPVDDLALGLAWGARLLRVCLVASALLLCRGCELPGTSAPYALVYTAEGCAEDVQAELAQARSVLQTGTADALMQIDAPSGSDVWANWMQTAAPGDTVLRAGVAPKDMASFVASLQPALAAAPFIADLANGLLYARTHEIAAVRGPALEAGGYAVVLSGGQRIGQGTGDTWGYTPEGLDLMRALKARWDVSGLCNPGAFIV